jgi:hypothetical protein
VSQSSDFCHHNPLCCFSMSVYCCCCLFRYRLSPETFGYTPVYVPGPQMDDTGIPPLATGIPTIFVLLIAGNQKLQRSGVSHLVVRLSCGSVRNTHTRNNTRQDLGCMAGVLMGFHRSTFSKPNTDFNSDLALCYFWAFKTMKMELRGKKFRSDRLSPARFHKCMERCKKCIACQGRYFERDRHRTSTKFRLGVLR